MNKHPLQLSAADIEKLINKTIKIDVGPINSEQVTNTYEGKIIDFSLTVGNEPMLPAYIKFHTLAGEILEINITEVKFIYYP
ncbi:MAG: hypothetical protein PVF73_07915 [Bacteroidales bacterium]|jgi:hypothetical protein